MSQIFTAIYHENRWQNDESRSGPGSTIARCVPVIEALLGLIEEFSVRTLLDAPCGDFNWMKEVPLPKTRYIGVDVVAEMVEKNQRLYGGDRREFQQADITVGPLPCVDMIFCRDALVHLCAADVFKALAVFKRSGSRYLVATTFPAQTSNMEIATGHWRPINLVQAPFDLPPPVRIVSDGCRHPGFTDKALGVWQLQELPMTDR